MLPRRMAPSPSTAWSGSGLGMVRAGECRSTRGECCRVPLASEWRVCDGERCFLTCTREPTGSATARSLCRATPPLSGAGDMVLPVRTTACRPRLTASTTPQHSARAITLLARAEEASW